VLDELNLLPTEPLLNEAHKVTMAMLTHKVVYSLALLDDG
jgi:hypothetical protein